MSVLDPDDVMDAEYREPVNESDDFYQNANQDEHEMEEDMDGGAESPIEPFHTAQANFTISPNEQEENTPVIVRTAAVDLNALRQLHPPMALLRRLEFIAESCPPLEKEALDTMIDVVKRDTMCASKYQWAMQRLEALTSRSGKKGDDPFLDHMQQSANARLDCLLTEFKKQKDEGVKESTRRAMEELFQHYVTMGQLGDALKLYNRGMREYCSQFKHVIQMWLNWLEVSIVAGEWSRVEPLLSQAQRALNDAEEAETVANARTPSNRTAAAPAGGAAAISVSRTNKQLIVGGTAKIDAIYGLNRLQQGKYRPAADKFLKLDVDLLGQPWLISASDVALYGTLCALATLDRNDLKKKVLNDSVFRKVLEAEPQLVELLQNFVRSQFGHCFDMLDKMRDRLLLDPHLCQHVSPLFRLIRRRAIVQYLKPFATADIFLMAHVFRTTAEKLEDELVELIESDEVCARVDSVEGVIRAQPKDKRAVAYQHILATANALAERAEATVLKAISYQAKVMVAHEQAEQQRRRRPQRGCATRAEEEEAAEGVVMMKGRRQPRIHARPISRPPSNEADSSGEPREPSH